MTSGPLSLGASAFTDPAEAVTSVARSVSKTQPYTDPTDGERDVAGIGLARLLIGDLPGAAEMLAGMGFTITADIDPVTSRRFVLAVSETDTPRAWGLYLLDTSEPPGLCIAVPHPKSDVGCEHLALRLWRAVPGSILAMAAVHRKAASGAADHSRNTASVFHHLWTAVLGPRGVPQVQIHGFADTTAPEQVAVSTGVGPATPAAVRIADEIAATGLVTTRSWEGTTDPDLRATTNVQGVAADASDWIWVHVEHNRTVRDDEARWHPAIDAIAAANPTLLAYDRPSPGGRSHPPKPVGATARAGTSRYLAREDHVHRGAAAHHAHPEPVVRIPPVTLTDAEVITIDSSRGDFFRVGLRADRTLAAPINGTDGQRLLLEVLAVGADRSLLLDESILLSAGVCSPVTIAAGKRWFASMVSLGTGHWMIIATGAQS
jgi:hypothetical protein